MNQLYEPNQEIQSLYESMWRNVAQEIGKPKCLIEQDGIGILPIHSIIAVKGKAKQGKSQGVTILAAAVLGDRTFGFTPTEFAENSKVLYFDTEQSDEEFIGAARRLHKLLNWEEREPNERLSFCSLIGIPQNLIFFMIEKAIKETKPSLVVIDGIADLVSDINSSNEAHLCLKFLIDIAKKEDCCIMVVLHENKGHDDKSMRGHLGTWLLNKATNVYGTKKEQQKSSEIFSLFTDDSRKGKIKPVKWELEINVKEGTETIIPLKSKQTESNLREIFNSLLRPNEPKEREEVCANYCQKTGKTAKTFETLLKEGQIYGIVVTRKNPNDNRKAIIELNSTLFNF